MKRRNTRADIARTGSWGVFLLAAATGLLITITPASAAPRKDTPAASPGSESYWRGTGRFMVGGEPFMLVVAPGIHYRHVYHRDENFLFDNLYLDAGIDVWVVPTMPGLRVGLEWMPLAAVIVGVSYQSFFYTGLPMGFGHGLSFESSQDPFDSDTLDARTGEEEAEVAHRAVLSVTLRAKAWRFALMNQTDVAGWYVHGDGDVFWYESMSDSLIARGRVDGTLMNRTALMFEGWKGKGKETWMVGIMNEYSRTFRSEIERDRIGAMTIFTPTEQLWGIDHPTFVLAAGTTFLHPHRNHDFWVLFAFSMSLDLR